MFKLNSEHVWILVAMLNIWFKFIQRWYKALGRGEVVYSALIIYLIWRILSYKWIA